MLEVMKLLTTSRDEKINASNHLVEMTIGEYLSIARNILDNNDLQRRRVKTANRTYSLLKDDIKTGCVLPPIVLSFFPQDEPADDLSPANIIQQIQNSASEFIILDGLQRTYTILDLQSEVAGDETLLAKINSLPLRIEVYTGISKVGVLYRMLTLNTGQTPMSTRHQIEILYSDHKEGIDGLVFISEADNKTPSGDNEFKFSDVLDGFLSYISGDYLPFDREDLVAIIKNLETLTKDDKRKDIFKLFTTLYNSLRKRFNIISNNWEYEPIDGELTKKAFANTVNQLFTKVQVISGFGAALSFLIKAGLVDNLEEVESEISQINAGDSEVALNTMIRHLDEIQINAKKIGNEQRMYFYYFIRSLLNKTNDGYLNVESAINQAYIFYKANTLR